MFVSKEVKDKMDAENQAAYDALKIKEIQDRRRRVFEQVALANLAKGHMTLSDGSMARYISTEAELILSESDIFASKVQG